MRLKRGGWPRNGNEKERVREREKGKLILVTVKILLTFVTNVEFDVYVTDDSLLYNQRQKNRTFKI